MTQSRNNKNIYVYVFKPSDAIRFKESITKKFHLISNKTIEKYI